MSESDISESDIENIRKIIVMVKDKLSWAVEVYPVLAPSWLDWKPSDDWDFIRSRLDDSIYAIKHFYDFDEATRKEISVALRNHGLVGPPVERKWTRLDSAIKRVNGVFSDLRKAGKRKVLGWTLKLLDDVMDSLSSAFPPLGAVTEFKKAIETALHVPTELEDDNSDQ
ncbi:MAG: hypothetical protein ACLPY5_05480 [Candidatus Bathyarchaeia archaeon]